MITQSERKTRVSFAEETDVYSPKIQEDGDDSNGYNQETKNNSNLLQTKIIDSDQRVFRRLRINRTKTLRSMGDSFRSSLDLGIIGNCSFSALVNNSGRIVQCCMPTFDSNPIFSRLLAGDDPPDSQMGFWDVYVDDFLRGEQTYIKNTAILKTLLYDKKGNILEIKDFAPRFYAHGRVFCPSQFIRIITPIKGNPRISIRIRPTDNYHSELCRHIKGSNHISYISDDFNCRLTSSLPVAFIWKEVYFVLTRQHEFVFGIDEPLRDNLHHISQEFLNNTLDYQYNFSDKLQLPLEWQSEIIRAAITLKLCQYESSGAILAAMTTSIPEHADSGRNQDYRFCWLRDSFHTIQALNRLGNRKSMESFLAFIVNIVSGLEENGDLQPLYGLMTETDLEERICQQMKGYRSQGPVRIGNDAFTQLQNDNYGSVIMSLMLMFYDERVRHPDLNKLYLMLERLGMIALDKWNKPDAGLWELRGNQHVHTFSSAMCQAACDRLARIANKLDNHQRQEFWREKADNMKKCIIRDAQDETRNSFVAYLDKETLNGKDKSRPLDASVLLLAHIGIVDPKSEKFIQTVEAIRRELMVDDFCFRYVVEDDFGFPENSFIVCTFWYIDALYYIGRIEEARNHFTKLLSHTNHLGLFSEDISTKTGELWGNFPQTYSMVGIINTAINLSKSQDSLCL